MHMPDLFGATSPEAGDCQMSSGTNTNTNTDKNISINTNTNTKSAMTGLHRVLVIPSALALSLSLLYAIVRAAPGEAEMLHFPSNLEDIRSLAALLTSYSHLHPSYVLLLFSSSYLFKQTFAVPGSVFLNVLAGAIFGSTFGFFLCSFLTACGASCCYLLARMVGEGPLAKWFPDTLSKFRSRLEENRAELPFFLLFLRLFPMSPNWALNMASGVLGVPLHLFFISVLLGLMPYNYLCVTSGAILSDINDLSDIVSWTNMARCLTAALAALLPTALLNWKNKDKQTSGSLSQTSQDKTLAGGEEDLQEDTKDKDS